MRFDPSFRQAQRAEWASFSLAYGTLKRSVKASSSLDSDNKHNNIRHVEDQIREQCNHADEFYVTELNRLQTLFARSIVVLRCRSNDPDSDVIESESDDSRVAQLYLVNAALLYVEKQVRRLLLFAKLNLDAASQIIEKMKRASAQQAEGGGKVLNPKSLDRSGALHLALDVANALQEMPNDLHFNEEFWHTDGDRLLQPFLSDNAVHEDYQLHQIIQLAGFDAFYRDLKDTSLTVWTELVSRYIEKMSVKALQASIGSSRDVFGRSPFHHAAEFGLIDIIRVLSHIAADRDDSASISERRPWLEQDVFGMTPLDLAVSNGQTTAMSTMLSTATDLDPQLPGNSVHTIRLIRSAIEMADISSLTELLTLEVHLDLNDDRGQLLLCVAVRRSLPQACRLMLNKGANPNLIEKSTGRTALGYACILCNISSVQLLLEGGADLNLADAQGWTPQDHAAYRGHLEIVEHLACAGAISHLPPYSSQTRPMCTTNKSKASHIPWVHPISPGDDSCVWISVGSMDATKVEPAVHIHNIDRHESGCAESEHLAVYSVGVSVEGDPKVSHEISLPILKCTLNYPWFFRTKDLVSFRLIWKLYKMCQPQGKFLVGSGIVSLERLQSGLTQNMESLVRDATVLLQSPEDLSYVGSVNFSFFWTSLRPPQLGAAVPRSWNFGKGVGGHRGSGKNRIDHAGLQIGENTAQVPRKHISGTDSSDTFEQSFLTAVQQGASFIEFDVQLTKDLVPVVYHDFLLSETGTDLRMHDLSFEQFHHLNRTQGPRRPAGKRSNSLEAVDSTHLNDLIERMGLTNFNKINGFKANTRGSFIREPSCSLREILDCIGNEVPMNIELKYPMLFECQEWSMETVALKVDLFVNKVLDTIFEAAGERSIVLSSFSPEVCIALSNKQRTYPVFFLSKTSAPRGETRSCCIQEAVHFAKAWGLPGIVTECTPLIRCPKLINYVKSAGLALSSFGQLNCDPEYAKIQFQAGINAVITDRVGAIVVMRDNGEYSTDLETSNIFP